MKKILMVLVVLLVVVGAVAAQEEEPKMAANVNVFGIIGGNYVANFEYMVTPWMGAMVEAGMYLKPDSKGFTGSLHGRIHPSQELSSFFVAPFFKYQYLTGVVTENSTEYDFNANVMVFGGNLGWRWTIGPGVSVVLRGGYGYSVINSKYPDGEPTSKDLVDTLLGIFAGIDGELSVGYAF